MKRENNELPYSPVKSQASLWIFDLPEEPLTLSYHRVLLTLLLLMYIT